MKALRLCVLLVACGPAVPKGMPEGTPKLVVTPLALDFGTITTKTATLTLTLENTGDGPLKLGKPVLSSPVQFDVAAVNEVIEAGERQALAVKFTPSGYGARTGTLKIGDFTVALSGETKAPEPCALVVAPDALAFGKLAPGATKELSFTITATKGNCALSAADLIANANPAFSLPDGSIGPRLLSAGETLTVPVRVKAPSVPGSLTGSVLVLFDGGKQAPVALSASVQAADCLRMTPDVLTFGIVNETCQGPTRSVSISNACSEPVTINSVAFGAAAFSISPTTPLASGTVLGPAGAPPRVIQLRFEPAQVGPANGKMIVTSTQSGNAVESSVTLEGVVEPTLSRTRKFFAYPRWQADVLFIFDNSPSMAAFSSNTITNLERAFDIMSVTNVQYAVTTADPANGGRIIGDVTNPKLIDGSAPDAKARLLQKFTQLPSTPSVPPVLAIATAAISPALAASDNAGLFRPTSRRYIIIVTNTDDHSALPEADYATLLQGYSVNPITCNTQGITCHDRLLYVAFHTGFFASNGNIESPDWNEVFGDTIDPRIPNSEFYFYEDLQPQPQTLTVSVNGIPVSATSATGAVQWTYDAVTHSLTFDPTFPLAIWPNESQIDVAFAPVCP